MAERYVHTGDHGTGRIRNRPDDQGSVGLLGGRKRHQSQQKDKSCYKAALSFHDEVPSLENNLLLRRAQFLCATAIAVKRPLSPLSCFIACEHTKSATILSSENFLRFFGFSQYDQFRWVSNYQRRTIERAQIARPVG